MAKKITLVCDFDSKHEATESMVVVLDDTAVELDACEPCAKKAKDPIEKVLAVGRPVTFKDLAKRSNGGDVDLGEVRLWCAAQVPPIAVAAKGRIAADIIERYLAAHPNES